MKKKRWETLSNTSIGLEFSIWGELDPDDITRKLEIIPTKSGRKGDINERPGGVQRIQQVSTWDIIFDDEETLDFDAPLKKLLAMIKDKRTELKEIGQMPNVTITFGFVINIEQGRTPGTYFYPEFVEFAGYIGAGIDIDIYVYSLAEDEDDD